MEVIKLSSIKAESIKILIEYVARKTKDTRRDTIVDVPKHEIEVIMSELGIKTIGDFVNTPLSEISQIASMFRKSGKFIMQMRKVLERGRESEISIYKQGETPENNDEQAIFLSGRAYNALRRNGILIAEDLIGFSENDIKNFKNLGTGSFEEIKKELERVGITLDDTGVFKGNSELNQCITAQLNADAQKEQLMILCSKIPPDEIGDAIAMMENFIEDRTK